MFHNGETYFVISTDGTTYHPCTVLSSRETKHGKLVAISSDFTNRGIVHEEELITDDELFYAIS